MTSDEISKGMAYPDYDESDRECDRMLAALEYLHQALVDDVDGFDPTIRELKLTNNALLKMAYKQRKETNALRRLINMVIGWHFGRGKTISAMNYHIISCLGRLADLESTKNDGEWFREMFSLN